MRFLRNDINTQKLFEFLSQKIVSANYPDGKDSCDRFTDGWLQYMFDPNCGYRYSCHPCWQIPLFTYIKYFCEYLGGLWYRGELSINSTVYGALVNK